MKIALSFHIFLFYFLSNYYYSTYFQYFYRHYVGMKSLPSTTLQLQSTHYNSNLCLENERYFFCWVYFREMLFLIVLDFDYALSRNKMKPQELEARYLYHFYSLKTESSQRAFGFEAIEVIQGSNLELL